MIITKRAWQMMVSVAGACIVGYFLYHTVEGDRGWLSMIRLEKEVAAAQEDLSHLQKERQELEHRVQLMRPGSLDPDLLDEQSRKLLDYSKPGEIVILTRPQGQSDPARDENMLHRSK